MKYLELEFTINPYNRDAADLLTALAADAGLDFIPISREIYFMACQKELLQTKLLC